ncbi:hypothetical protein D9M68_682720 [compost metagenome]
MPNGAARLEQHHFANMVHVGFQMNPLVEHGLTGHLAHTTDNNLAALTFGMTIHHGQNLLKAHCNSSKS